MDIDAYKRDLFTPKSASRGNGVLEKPVGLITADEVAFAGGFEERANKEYYLYNNQHFWTMSPSSFLSPTAVFAMSGDGSFGHYGVNDKYSSNNDKGGIRPVINLRADIEISGKGLINDPYIIKTE